MSCGKGVPSIVPADVLAGPLLQLSGYSTNDVLSSTTQTTLFCSWFAVAIMASPLKVGQVLRGAKDVYVVARKLHDQVWTARLVN
jgi:hypothetical protein